VIKKSLCTWRLQYNHQVHRDFLITLYIALYWRVTEDGDLSLKHVGRGGVIFMDNFLWASAFIYINDKFHTVLFPRHWKKYFPGNFVFSSHYHTTNHLRCNISLFKTEAQADEVGEHSEKAVNWNVLSQCLLLNFLINP